MTCIYSYEVEITFHRPRSSISEVAAMLRHPLKLLAANIIPVCLHQQFRVLAKSCYGAKISSLAA